MQAKRWSVFGLGLVAYLLGAIMLFAGVEDRELGQGANMAFLLLLVLFICAGVAGLYFIRPWRPVR